MTLEFLPLRDTSRKNDVRTMNIEAAKAVADAVRTSLGPRGMDKMVCIGSFNNWHSDD